MSAGNLKLDYLKESQAVLDIYFEDVYPNDDQAEKRTAERMLLESAVCALVSMARDLRRIVDEEAPA